MICGAHFGHDSVSANEKAVDNSAATRRSSSEFQTQVGLTALQPDSCWAQPDFDALGANGCVACSEALLQDAFGGGAVGTEMDLMVGVMLADSQYLDRCAQSARCTHTTESHFVELGALDDDMMMTCDDHDQSEEARLAISSTADSYAEEDAVMGFNEFMDNGEATAGESTLALLFRAVTCGIETDKSLSMGLNNLSFEKQRAKSLLSSSNNRCSLFTSMGRC